MSTVALPVRTMRCVGVKLVVVTNAAGGLRSEYAVGDVAVIRDHVALPLLSGRNPLVGPNDDELGTRFPPTSDLYDGTLQRIVADSAKSLGYGNFLRLNATYAFVSGPQYESKAECAMLRSMGADAVGMSTIPEVVAAHHAGMAVLCLSLITNKVVFAADTTADTTTEEEAEGGEEGGGGGHAHHEEVLRAVSGRSEQLIKLVGEVVCRIGEVYLPTLADLAPIDLKMEGRMAVGVVVGEGGGEKWGGRGGCLFGLYSSTAPHAHCVIMGGAILAAGILLGARMGKRSS
jgi:purine-nucleoside phosphorylase